MNPNSPDISIIRPEIKDSEIHFRGNNMPPARLKKIKKALITFHSLEVMAANIYRHQISHKKTELNRQLIAAMLNEMTHIQDFEVKLNEFGWNSSRLKYLYWIIGFILGFSSRLFGKKSILKVAIWVETKAVIHYKSLLNTVEWDEDTRLMIEKNQADEYGHINRWKNSATDI